MSVGLWGAPRCEGYELGSRPIRSCAHFVEIKLKDVLENRGRQWSIEAVLVFLCKYFVFLGIDSHNLGLY